MADFNLVGNDLNTGQYRPVGPNDASTDTIGNSLVGRTGIAGVTGLTGATPSLEGERGLTGSMGVTGFAPTGIFGETGIVGATGLIGRTGVRGLTGFSNGSQGITGFRGLTGANLVNPRSILFGATTITVEATLVGVTGGGFAITLPTPSAASLGRRILFYDITGVASSTPWSIIGSFGGLSGYTVIQNYQMIEFIGLNTTSWTVRFGGQGPTGLTGKTGIRGETGIQANTGMQGATGI